MRSSFLWILFAGVIFFSCKKESTADAPASLAGTWKMVLVRESATNAQLTKPLSVQGDVMITFVPTNDTSGTFSGNTPSNTFTGFGEWSNTYTLGPKQRISIPVLSMTKVNETSWGRHFVDHIRDARQYSFEAGGKLRIQTTEKALIFEKL